MSIQDRPTNVLYPFWGTSLGGSHIATLLLATNLPSNYRPVFLVHEDGALASHLRTRGVKYLLVPLIRIRNARTSRLALLVQIALSLPRLIAVLRKHSIGIVHASDGRMNVSWLLPARMARSSFVWHQHARYKRSIVADFFASRADQFISVSRFCAAEAPDDLGERVQTIANPFDPALAKVPIDLSRLKLRQRLGVSDKTFVLGFFGNFEPNKQADIFVSVIKRLCERRPNQPIIGCLFGEQREPVASAIRAQIAASRLDTRVRLMGFLYPPEEHLAGCDVVLACAVNDSFGRTIVEAMLVGVPVVASKSGGHAEIIRDGDNGTLVAPDDVEKYVDAILRLVTQDRSFDNLTQIRDEALERYSVTSHVNSVVQIYARLQTL